MEKEKIERNFSYTYSDKFELENLENRHLYINGEITDDIIDNVVYFIFRYNQIDKGVQPENRKPIFIYINSPGGDVTAGFSLIDAISVSETPVYTINTASCCSMGFLIFLAGHCRYSLSNSTYLWHDGDISVYGSMGKAKDLMKFEEQRDQRIKDYVLRKTLITDQQYDEKYRTEWYLYPEEAKELGIVSKIVGTDCSIDDIL